ncbi:hypothetical protein AVEN_62817-1 [Araneus ventricosus]|uniref:Uncharacterized protein n=1 Tax=Araneus ventricosus TaxID=182803 RepID=A0A4Y2IDN9_ARAVE|nr:hypothetical protein AVEN_62817-1 [Araneus ventricosus]
MRHRPFWHKRNRRETISAKRPLGLRGVDLLTLLKQILSVLLKQREVEGRNNHLRPTPPSNESFHIQERRGRSGHHPEEKDLSRLGLLPPIGRLGRNATRT